MYLEDNILDQITLKELIVTIECNEKKRCDATFRKVYKEILTYKLADGVEILEQYLKERKNDNK